MYARGDNDTYYKGLKVAQNVLIYPTGAAGKRFGTLYQATLTNINTGLDFFFQTFQYLNQCIYQLVFTAGTTYIYLEGIQVSSFSNPYDATTVANLSTTVLTNSSGAVFRVCAPNFQPYDLTRSHVDGTISSISTNRFVITGLTLTVGEVLPIQFTTTGTLPSTTPQIIAGKTYFCFQNTSSASSIYLTPQDAKFQTNAITLNTTGTGTNKILYYNAWTFSTTTWKNLPFYDFNGGYETITFTPTKTTGSSTINLSSAYSKLDSTYVGGVFFGNGGSGRITAVNSTTQFVISVQTPFVSTDGILGSLALLAEPAWSATRGYPQICSSYQNRAIFANTPILANGFWTSVINDFTDFGDLTTDDDDAISFYPNFNNINVINFVVPFRSITVHTNSGVYSNPLSEIYAITPNTFTLQLQDTTPAQVLEPQSIDNQILIVAGNDLHTMIWDGINNAYTSNIVSVANEQTIRNPVDQISYANLTRSGSRYCFIVNANGSMAIYQTLQSESIQGLTPHIMEQTYGDASFVQSASSFDGRAWFVCKRDTASAQTGINITAFTSSTLTAVASNLSTTNPTAVTFTTTGSLPASTPALATNTFYWAIGVTADTFNLYTTQADALAGTNAFVFTSAGTSSKLVPWTLAPVYTLEELTEDVKIDCAIYVNNGGSPSATATVPSFMNAQNLVAIGDNFGFSGTVENSTFTFNAHGSNVTVTEAYIGYAINLVIEPMPLSFPPGPQTTLMKPTHLRSIRWWFNNTIGGTINGSPIAISSFANVGIGEPPVPRNGIFEMSVMTGWDDINFPSFTIEHSDPFDIQLLGISYSIDV